VPVGVTGSTEPIDIERPTVIVVVAVEKIRRRRLAAGLTVVGLRQLAALDSIRDGLARSYLLGMALNLPPPNLLSTLRLIPSPSPLPLATTCPAS
jgi:hypothetical protein